MGSLSNGMKVELNIYPVMFFNLVALNTWSDSGREQARRTPAGRGDDDRTRLVLS